jgi:predicted N-formylglutamate amidohydrolase
MAPSIIITCEHAGNEIPEQYKNLFIGADDVLLSHRGWDPGAFYLAECLAERFSCELVACHSTRLLIETNRSIDSPDLFSDFSQRLTDREKEILKQQIYVPYRQAVEDAIQRLPKPVVHLSIHSFTPVLDGKTRQADIGLLFDPSRIFEAQICDSWSRNLARALPGFSIRFNEPYRGTDDGFTTWLRTKFTDQDYAGIEVEVNQKFNAESVLTEIQTALFDTFPF